MALEIVPHASPALQVRIDTSPTPAIELAVRHPYIPWRFRHYTYERNFVGVTTVTLSKISGGIETVIQAITAAGAQTSIFFDLDVEMGGGETIKVVSSGMEPSVGGEQHSCNITWEERLDQIAG